jgi:hypothetical protein
MNSEQYTTAKDISLALAKIDPSLLGSANSSEVFKYKISCSNYSQIVTNGGFGWSLQET